MKHPSTIRIGIKEIGHGFPVYFIAELSANHGGDYDRAVELVKKAHWAGADAVKLQTYTADTITLKSASSEFKINAGTAWDGRTLHDLYCEAMTPWEWVPKLRKLALDLGMELFSSAFDPTSVDYLEGVGVPAYKIASAEILDLGLIEKVMKTGKPLLLSTGMADEFEVRDAVEIARRCTGGFSLLRCTSVYPAPPEQSNLRGIQTLEQMYQVPVGFSDHTLGAESAIAAVALGATLIEKHLTLSRKMKNADSHFSSEPEEFKALVQAVRQTENALGNGRLAPSQTEIPSRMFRRSLYVVRDVKKGDRISSNDIRSVRPARGLSPKFERDVLGLQATQNISAGSALSWEMLGARPKKPSLHDLEIQFMNRGVCRADAVFDSGECKTLLHQITANQRLSSECFLSELQYRRNKNQKDNFEFVRNLVEKMDLSFIEYQPVFCDLMRNLLGEDYSIRHHELVVGVPESWLPDWMVGEVRNLRSLNAFVHPQFRQLNYTHEIPMQSSLNDSPGSSMNFLNAQVYLNDVDESDSPIRVSPLDGKGSRSTQTELLLGRRGSLFVWHPSLPDGTAPHRANKPRISVRYRIQQGRRTGLLDELNAQLNPPKQTRRCV